MSEDYTAEEEEAWVAGEREKVATYLAKELVQHLGVGEWPAFHAQPYLAIWAVQSKKSPGAIGWWAISGDVPTDYMSGDGVTHPREAMAYFSCQWSAVSECMRRGEAHPESKIGLSGDWPTLAPLLKARSELLGRFAADDALWDEP